jgi:hypothetical protein
MPMPRLSRASCTHAVLAFSIGLLLASGATGCSLSDTGSATRSGTPAAQPTPPPKIIVITTDRQQYTQSQVIAVTVQNVTNTAYYATEEYSACTMLVLQLRVNGAWQEVQPCLGGPEPQVRQLAPKVAFPLSFGPGNTPNNPNLWQPGTYRFALAYGTKSDGSGAQSFSYSASFAIGS